MNKIDLVQRIKILESSPDIEVSFRDVLIGIRTSYEDFENLSAAFDTCCRAASQGQPVDNLLLGYDSLVRLKGFYFLFCQNVLQLHGIFGDEYPGYQRIKFFRDKVIVHWLEYVCLNEVVHQMIPPTFVPQDGLLCPFLIPMAFFTSTEAKKDVFFDEINRVLLSKGKVSIDFCKDFDVEKIYEQYYSVLESVDPTYKTFLKGGKNKDLVNALYAWCFPPPFLSMRKYVEDLVSFLEASGKFSS